MIVSTQKQLHGGERQALFLADGLRELGHECKILARQGSGLANELVKLNRPVETFAGRGRNPISLWKIRRCLTELKPDVIHFNDSHAITSGGLAAAGLSIPVRVAARRVDFPLRSSTRMKHFADGVICVSNSTRQRCQEAGLKPSHLFVVHDGVDKRLAESGSREKGRLSLGIDKSTQMILVVGKLTDCKGHIYLLDAMPRILAAFPSAKVFFAGDGPLESDLQAQIQRRQLGKCVQMLGFRSDVPDLMAAADVLAVPSHTEGLCSSIIDALIAGCPVVATRVGGIPDLLEPQGVAKPCGQLVEPRNPTSLADGILHVLARPEETEQRSRQGKITAIESFTSECMVAGTLGVYRQLLTRNAALGRRAA